jgi:hypothetical protein
VPVRFDPSVAQDVQDADTALFNKMTGNQQEAMTMQRFAFCTDEGDTAVAGDFENLLDPSGK